MSDPKCCFCIPLHIMVWIYAVVQTAGLLSLVIQLEMFPAIFEAQMPMILVCFAMMIYVFLMLCIKTMDTHTSRLIFFNMYLAFPVLLYNMWYAFAIFNDWWISVPVAICRDTKNNPPRPNSPEFADCVNQIKDHTTIDLIVNLSFGAYLAYYFKKWAD